MLSEEQIQDIIDTMCPKEFFVWRMDPDNDPEDLEAFFNEESIMNHLDHPTVALMIEEDLTYSDAETEIRIGNWKVLEEYEADSEAEDAARDKTYDALQEIPKHLQDYFNEDDYEQDILSDGRGSLLNYENGEEYSQIVEGVTYYLYKQ